MRPRIMLVAALALIGALMPPATIASAQDADLASIGDTVFEDLNGNGINDPGEPPVPGVLIYTRDADGLIVASDVTDANGSYLISNLAPGDYQIEFRLVPGSTFTAPDIGGDDTIDSDADPTTGRTGFYSLSPGTNETSVDAGVLPPPTGSVGDFVFFDTNLNGVQDADDPGVPGVIVQVWSSEGVIVAADTTDAAGQYLVDNLPAGTYSLEFVLPAGLVFTAQDQGDDSRDSDADPATGLTALYTIAPGENVSTIDAGLVEELTTLGAIGDFVFFDADRNGVQGPSEEGVPGVLVTAIDAAGFVVGVTTTDANGQYLIDNLPAGDYTLAFQLPGNLEFTLQDQGDDDTLDSDVDPITSIVERVEVISGLLNDTVDAGVIDEPVPSSSVGNLVFEDLDADGIQDPGEPGLAGATISVSDAAGTIVGATVSDTDGLYLIGNLLPGEYTATISLPDGRALTASDVGADDSTDSDFDAATATTLAFIVVQGQFNDTIDAGVLPVAATTGSISGRVFDDVNDNGIEDPGEPGLSQGLPLTPVSIRLFDINDDLVGQFGPNSTGTYFFNDLAPGLYAVEYFAQGRRWIPADGDFTQPGGVLPGRRRTRLIELRAGESITNLNAGSVAGASIEGVAFFDDNFNDVGDESDRVLQFLEVVIRNQSDEVEWQGTTDTNGNYQAAVRLGEHVVEFAPPSRFVFVLQGVNGAGTPSDVDSDTGRSDAISVTSQQDRIFVNAGLRFAPPSIGLAQTIDAPDVNGDEATVRFRFTIANLGDVELSSIALSSTIAAAFPGVTIISGPTSTGDGCTDQAAAGTLRLAPAATCQAVWEITISGWSDTTYLSTATVRGSGPDGSTDFDTSDDGVDPDPNGNGQGDDDGERDLTPIRIRVGNGDVNCSGFADVIDAFVIASYDAAVFTDVGACPGGSRQLYAGRGDVNSDGATDIIDALFIAQCDAFLSNPYCDRMNIRP